MFDKISKLFKSGKPSEEELYLNEQNIRIDPEAGFIVDGVVLNQMLGARLQYLSNRRMANFDDLKSLYSASMIINEKIDLEIASQRYNAALENSEENLLEFKQIVQKLNDYYRKFLRDKK